MTALPPSPPDSTLVKQRLLTFFPKAKFEFIRPSPLRQVQSSPLLQPHLPPPQLGQHHPPRPTSQSVAPPLLPRSPPQAPPLRQSPPASSPSLQAHSSPLLPFKAQDGLASQISETPQTPS